MILFVDGQGKPLKGAGAAGRPLPANRGLNLLDFYCELSRHPLEVRSGHCAQPVCTPTRERGNEENARPIRAIVGNLAGDHSHFFCKEQSGSI